MLRPSYAELMDVMNNNAEQKVVNSRYTIVIAAAKRARQIIDGDDPMVESYKPGKPVSIAVEELNQAKISIVPEGEGTVVIPKKLQEEEKKKQIEERKAANEADEALDDADELDLDDDSSEDEEIEDETEE